MCRIRSTAQPSHGVATLRCFAELGGINILFQRIRAIRSVVGVLRDAGWLPGLWACPELTLPSPGMPASRALSVGATHGAASCLAPHWHCWVFWGLPVQRAACCSLHRCIDPTTRAWLCSWHSKGGGHRAQVPPPPALLAPPCLTGNPLGDT